MAPRVGQAHTPAPTLCCTSQKWRGLVQNGLKNFWKRLDVWLREDVGECVAPREGQVLHILTLTNPPGPFSDFPRTF